MTRGTGYGLRFGSGVLRRTPPALSAQAVADYLTTLAGTEPDGRVHLSLGRLQHLLYLAQGWSLANRDRALFSEDIEAWEHGPVIRAVYARYRSVPEGTAPPRWEGRFLTEEEKEWVRATWEATALRS